MIALRDVVKVLGGRRVLDGLTLGVPEGRVVALMGPSGVGKTVTVKHILGLLVPDRGDVLVEGHSLPEMSEEEAGRLTARRLGVMLQGGGLFGSQSLHENVAIALRRTRAVPAGEVDEVAGRWLAEVGLGRHSHKHPRELSVGMRTRAALARALATEAPIVVLDDIEAGLDPVRASLICDLVLRVHAQRRCTVLVTTHNVDLAAHLADVLAVMAAGRIVACGPPAELLRESRPLENERFVHRFLRGDPGVELDPRSGPDQEYSDPDPLDGPDRDRVRLVVLSVALVLLTLLSIYWLIPVLQGDLSLNPYSL